MNSERRGRRWLRWVVFAYLISAIVLGFMGLTRQYPNLPAVEYALRVFQLFSTYGAAAPDPAARSLNAILQLARAMAGMVALAAVAEVVRRAMGERWTTLRLRLTRGHVVICGLGAKGRHLAGNLRLEGVTVAGIDCAAQADGVTTARETGLHVFGGDATESFLLLGANLPAAAALVAFSGSDRTNVEIAMAARAVRRPANRRPLRCAVHLTGRRRRELLQQSGLFRPEAGCEVSFFNLDELTARLLLNKSWAGEHGTACTHLISIGFGHLGESLALHHAQLAHYPDGMPPTITVLTPEAKHHEAAFLARHPNFREVCGATFIDCDLSAGGFGKAAVTERLAVGRSLVTVSAAEEDVGNVFIALELLAACPDLDLPIYIRMREARGLENLAKLACGPHGRVNLIPFGQLKQVCRREIILGERLDLLARGVHEQYRCQAFARGEIAGDTPSLEPWEKLSEDLRESNRRQADHHEIKIRLAGLKIVPQTVGEIAEAAPVVWFKEEEIESLGRTEHARWCAERRLAGWRSGSPRDDARRVHPLLVPWEELVETDREKNRVIVRGLPELLARVGYRIARREGSMGTAA